MEMPSVYSPFKMDTSFSKLPLEEMGKLTELVGNTIKTNEQSISNFDTALGSLKTHPELMPELQEKVKKYQDLVEQSAGLAKTDPMRYLQIGSQLREAGRALTKDMTTGDIGKYTNAYNHFNASLAADLKDPKKNQSDVLQYYANKKNQDIANLKQGKEIGQASAPEYFNQEKYIRQLIKDYPETTYVDASGKTVTGKNPDALRSYLRDSILHNKEYLDYRNSITNSIPQRAIPTPVETTPDQRPVYMGRVKDKNGNYIINSDGTPEIGRTLDIKEAVPNDDLDTLNRIDRAALVFGQANPSKTTDGVPDKDHSNASIVTAPTKSIVTTPPVYKVYTGSADEQRINQLKKIYDDPNTPPDVKETARQEWDQISSRRKEAGNNHNYIYDLTLKAMRGQSGIDINSLGQIETLKKQIDATGKALYNAPTPKEREINYVLHDSLNNELGVAERTKALFASTYDKLNKELYSKKVDEHKALSTIQDPVLQKVISQAIATGKSSVTITDNEGKVMLDANATLNTIEGNDYTKNYSFDKVIPTETGVKVQAIDKNTKKEVVFTLKNGSDIITNHILNNPKKYNKDVRSFAKAINDPEVFRVTNELAKVLLPATTTNYGPKQEINISSTIKLVVRKTTNGGIISSVHDSKDNSITVLPIRSNTGDIIDTVRDYIQNPMAFKNQTGPNFVDPEKVDIFPSNK